MPNIYVVLIVAANAALIIALIIAVIVNLSAVLLHCFGDKIREVLKRRQSPGADTKPNAPNPHHLLIEVM